MSHLDQQDPSSLSSSWLPVTESMTNSSNPHLLDSLLSDLSGPEPMDSQTLDALLAQFALLDDNNGEREGRQAEAPPPPPPGWTHHAVFLPSSASQRVCEWAAAAVGRLSQPPASNASSDEERDEDTTDSTDTESICTDPGCLRHNPAPTTSAAAAGHDDDQEYKCEITWHKATLPNCPVLEMTVAYPIPGLNDNHNEDSQQDEPEGLTSAGLWALLRALFGLERRGAPAGRSGSSSPPPLQGCWEVPRQEIPAADLDKPGAEGDWDNNNWAKVLSWGKMVVLVAREDTEHTKDTDLPIYIGDYDLKVFLSECANWLENVEILKLIDVLDNNNNSSNDEGLILSLNARAASRPPPAVAAATRVLHHHLFQSNNNTEQEQQHAFVPIKLSVLYADDKHGFFLAPAASGWTEQSGNSSDDDTLRIDSPLPPAGSPRTNVMDYLLPPSPDPLRPQQQQQQQHVVRWEVPVLAEEGDTADLHRHGVNGGGAANTSSARSRSPVAMTEEQEGEGDGDEEEVQGRRCSCACCTSMYESWLRFQREREARRARWDAGEGEEDPEEEGEEDGSVLALDRTPNATPPPPYTG